LAFLQAREAEMLRREVSSLDELDHLEAAEKAEAEWLPSAPTPPLSLLSGDFSEFLADWDAASLDGLGSSPPLLMGSSQGS
jgi:hypothetical protein